MQNCLRSAEALELMMMPHGSVGKWLLQHTRVEWPIHWRTLNLPPSLHPQLGLLLTAYTLLQVLWRREIKTYNKVNLVELYKWYIFVSCSLGTVVLVINFLKKVVNAIYDLVVKYEYLKKILEKLLTFSNRKQSTMYCPSLQLPGSPRQGSGQWASYYWFWKWNLHA